MAPGHSAGGTTPAAAMFPVKQSGNRSAPPPKIRAMTQRRSLPGYHPSRDRADGQPQHRVCRIRNAPIPRRRPQWVSAMGDVIEFRRPRPPVTTEQSFGGCPTCGGNDGYLNVGPDHWCVCAAHKMKWPIGSNLFSDWRDESEDDWTGNVVWLDACHTVQPIYPMTRARR